MDNYFLDFHKRCIKGGKLPSPGLCYCIKEGKYAKMLELLSPTDDDKRRLVADGRPSIWWGRDNQESYFDAYTPLRQTIVLFCHEILNRP